MGVIKALLVGVSEYPVLKCTSLPLCKNDLYAVRSALMNGLNVNINNIVLCGECGIVTSGQLVSLLRNMISDVTDEDTFIFYYSGHGGEKCLALSDGLINLQELIDIISGIKAKNKIAILDSCHSGSFSLGDIPKMDIHKTVDDFVGRGYAVMASCGADEVSGFNSSKQISLYTSFVCDALTARFLIRKGKKSLESINEAIFHFAEISNRKRQVYIQQPIFRSSIGGTIFFDVEKYNPYHIKEIYEEADKYIIYSVSPVHHGMAKRLSVKVILRYQSTKEEIGGISKEIKDKVLFYEVHQNQIAEARHKGRAANIVWCYFGYDEDDMVNSNFICHTTWVDDAQDKEWWYRTSKDTFMIDGIHMQEHNSYEMIKDMQKSNMVRDEFIEKARECSSSIISIAEQYIKVFREYLNKTVTEEQLISSLEPLNKVVSLYYFKITDLPVPPINLHDWMQAHMKIACTVHDFSLFYSSVNKEVWSTDNRKWLMLNSIKNYEAALEELKLIDKLI